MNRPCGFKGTKYENQVSDREDSEPHINVFSKQREWIGHWPRTRRAGS